LSYRGSRSREAIRYQNFSSGRIRREASPVPLRLRCRQPPTPRSHPCRGRFARPGELQRRPGGDAR